MTTGKAGTSTETTTTETAVATTTPGQFALTLPTKQEIAEIFAENMEGVVFQCERVKIPSGGGVVWEITDDDGNTDTPKELLGVIIDHHPANGYWAEEYSGKNQPPDCSSMDGVTGTPGVNINGVVYKNCATCPMNQFGSDPKGGAGKACKNMHRVYLLREETVFPLLVTLPPTSLSAIKDYVRRLTNKLKRLSGVVSKITLEKDKNEGGIQFSKAVFARAGELDKAEAQKIAEHARVLKPYLRQIGLTNDDYNVGSGPSSAADVDDLPDADSSGTSGAGFTGTTIDVPAGGSTGGSGGSGGDQSAQGGGDAGKAW